MRQCQHSNPCGERRWHGDSEVLVRRRAGWGVLELRIEWAVVQRRPEVLGDVEAVTCARLRMSDTRLKRQNDGDLRRRCEGVLTAEVSMMAFKLLAKSLLVVSP